MMILIKQCDIYAPEHIGQKDILIGGGKVLTINKAIRLPGNIRVEIIDASGFRAIPGLIDCHIHIAGSGGEGGPASRTPELKLSQMLKGGITTVIGLLGTDGLTRTVESVLMKVKALRAEGVSAWMYTGSYQIPTPTILGNVGKDISMINEIIGVGEVAISDHRSSRPTVDELIRMASLARVGGMLGGKAGIVNIHIGDEKNPFALLHQAIEKSEVQPSQFLPTHCNRNEYVFEDAKSYGKKGHIDLTAYPNNANSKKIKASHGVMELLRAGVPLEHITISSDGCGSIPIFDESGNLLKLDFGNPDAIYKELLELVRVKGLPWEKALQVVTTNVANVLKLKGKGSIGTGMDADILLLNKKDDIDFLIANGTIMIKGGELIKKGNFE